MRTFYEFFAGGGMARAGLGAEWQCLFANDCDPKKVASYRDNWGSGEVHLGDVNEVSPDDLPGKAELIWASFPCQDLSLAGAGAGLKGERSGTFWPFWRKVQHLIEMDRKPRIIALENVTGMLSSHQGKDFQAICRALGEADYRFGAVVVDAAHFVPQSRKRVFIVGVASDYDLPSDLEAVEPSLIWHPAPLQRAMARLSPSLQEKWIWWALPTPGPRQTRFKDLFEAEPTDVPWHSQADTEKLLSMMSEFNRNKLKVARTKGEEAVGTLYRRTRPSPSGGVQRAEIRLDGTAGCLRTPSGGSSRQIVVHASPKGIRSRLISAREAARLMGLPESYMLPTNYNDAYHLLGDGLAVPAVNFVARHILDRLTPSQLAKAA